MTAATLVGIGSIVVGFVLIGAAFLAVARKGNYLAGAAFGIGAFVFITVIPVFLAVFVAAPHPTGS
ncbi:hypothetical protein CAPI_09105 [Corynebacterium capitovis DSM 44611]|uniref:hypothetical protein n=1 Tax=Corynebacterium capitovis TaxID=131081 RepID=UPI00058E473A|nr:hypothetical protein [Corynebacterium capitovis]WKD58344.1 hypothetical protein CAPI_09105 [Corynebacterium capitovis DSM 44611]